MAYTERNRSPSPPLQPVSKGDRRRRQLQDRLSDMVANFSKDRDQHYRAQLNALQVDMNLIMRADAYVDSPLDDDPDAIAELIKELTGGSVPQNQAALQDFFAMAGRRYQDFVQQVNKAQEERDANLTMLWNRRQTTEDDAHYTAHYKRFLAKEEQQQLKNTIRERQISVLSQRRAKMLRDKEQLDIADSNAAFLHPNQFSITNPSSPGGPQNPRKTRHTRHQRGDPDDTVEAGTKRKRRLYHDEYENGSPVPAARNIDYGVGSPLRDAKSKLLQTQFEAPLYSIERLFSEKELAMVTNAAHIAAAHHFAQLRMQDPNVSSTTAADQPNQDIDDTDVPRPDLTADGTGATTTAATAADDDANLPLSAPEMDRSASTQTHYHATRHATRNLHPLGELAALASSSDRPGAPLPFPSTRPVALPVNKANAAAPPPPPLSAQEIETDLAIMGLSGGSDPAASSAAAAQAAGLPAAAMDTLNDRLLERACAPASTRFLPQRVPGLALPGGAGATVPVQESALRGGPGSGGPGVVGLGGVPMSAQSSFAGASDVPGSGGVAMNRVEGSSRGLGGGGVGMRRTASGAGEFARRMKGRGA
ncbi:MAG: hypothetical protein M1821_002641 [Bathelium mastoideum]|nr:MAG: hypothetical protein M1821_002641 [Bathelium mastoideum]KAI9685498.1 MAG: hypothetical protein M1822_004356 [Bathelium mastoideum]